METSPLSGVWLGNRGTIRGGVDGTVLSAEHGFGRHLFWMDGEIRRRVDGPSHANRQLKYPVFLEHTLSIGPSQ